MRWKANPQAVVQRMGDTMVVVNLESDRILELNETAAWLFELASAGLTLSELTARLSHEFDVQQDEAERHLGAAMDLLVQEQILERHAG